MGNLDAKFFKPFVDGALATFKLQCQLEAQAGKPFFKGQQGQPNFEIAGIIGLTSNGFNGTISILFTEQVFLKIMSNMLCDNFKEITQDLQDGAAELLNIIFGHAKVVLNQQGFTIQKAIPTVIRGKGLKTTHMAKNPVMVLPFSTASGEFHIEICTESQSM